MWPGFLAKVEIVLSGGLCKPLGRLQRVGVGKGPELQPGTQVAAVRT